MQLVRCRVVNFRSVQNSGLFPLSDDNITGIIGQNESGKTSVLEALKAFATEEVSGEVLRSDGTMPEVTCVFKLPTGWATELFPDNQLPRELVETIRTNSENCIALTRVWTTPDDSELRVDNVPLDEFFPPQSSPVSTPPEEVATVEEETADDAEAEEVEEPQPAKEIPEPPPLTKQDFIIELVNSLPQFELFMDFSSLLPDTIDVADIVGKKTSVEGYQGAINLLKLIDIDIAAMDEQVDERFIKNKISTQNRILTANFRDFWSQQIGGKDKIGIEVELDYHNAKANPEKAGLPYLNFWIVDNCERLRPRQRSKGVMWFLSFYLQLSASAKTKHDNGLILLIDEPASSLHAKAQEDVLKVFEQLREDIQIIYTTHSPYLLDLNKIYRLAAAQREESPDDSYSPCNIKILTAHELGAATTDTLTPIFGCMDISFAHQNVIKKENNIIVEEISVCYYLKALLKLKQITGVNLLPANGTSNVPVIANMLLGWGIKFGVLVDDEDSGKRMVRKLRKQILPDDADLARKLYQEITGCHGIEDIFSRTDFARFVVNVDPAIITVANSKYVDDESISKGLTAVKFLKQVEDGTLTFESLDDLTKQKLDALHAIVQDILASQSPVATAPAPAAVSEATPVSSTTLS